MPSNSNSSPSSSSSDNDDQNPNSNPDPSPNPKPNANPVSIDQSLDAIENQLASISMSSRATVDDEEEVGEEEGQPVEQLKITNGSLSEEIGEEGATDYIEDEHIATSSMAESSGVIKESPPFVWRNNLEAHEVERPLSPSSSGYAGEMGSTSGGDEIIDDDEDGNEIREVGNGVWGPMNSGFRENAIVMRYGDEHKLAGFSATLQAIISFVENGRDRVKLVRAGKHQATERQFSKFLKRSHKSRMKHEEDSSSSSRVRQLRGTWITVLMGRLLSMQRILILTKSVNRCFEKEAKMDDGHHGRGGTELSSLASCSQAG
ncbi:Vacuolar fusion protein MON1 [Sesamum angolense]|uniref:Vacuolar fusion protein MON1 homolog n=1 Tax=Sesamum angolense TaxID=2727404 RepID=A0AAE1XBP2_9LAMI|nr:Vacuolar fusion protein MON1 [Sesamum angolense]